MAIVIPRSYIENYSKTLNLASEKARESLVAALTQLDYSRPVAEIRDAVISIMQVACGASTDIAARLAADFYDGLRVRMVGESFGAVAESMRNPDATDGAIRAFIQTIVDGGDVEKFIQKCAGRLDYENNRAANMCMAANAKKDPIKAKWARVPTDDDACEFCLMLASRGFVYGSMKLASHSHENCRCRVIPGWKDSTIEGYNSDKYFSEYLNKTTGGSVEHQQRIIDDAIRNGAAKLLGSGSRFSGVLEMKDYLYAAKDIDDLYERAEIVMQDYKKYWKPYGNTQEMFNSISKAAKEVRAKFLS